LFDGVSYPLLPLVLLLLFWFCEGFSCRVEGVLLGVVLELVAFSYRCEGVVPSERVVVPCVGEVLSFVTVVFPEDVLLFSGVVAVPVRLFPGTEVVPVRLFSGVPVRLFSIDGLPAGRETVPSERVFVAGVVAVFCRVLVAVDVPPRIDVLLREFS